MSRIGKFLAVGWTGLCVTLAMAFLGTVEGCSDSTGTIEQAKRDEAVDQVVQDKMKDFMSKKGGPPQKK
ncbi:MAG: hypothetical protein ACLQIB_42090 [Isosphaeraceae bacterium]